MRTTSPSQSGLRRALLATALSLPLSALMLGGSAYAEGPGAPGERGGSASSSQGRESAPGQEKKKDAEQPAQQQQTAPAPEQQKAEPAPAPAPEKKKADPAPAPKSSKGSGSANGASGDTSEPQPLSNADRNGTGANPGKTCDHAYCSTRDGSPSLNGNGGGGGGGKPCAGCVGKADNKNPPGQAPDGSDHNNGYECDGNNGIGKTNPAHTGCKPATVTPPPPAPCVDAPGAPCTPTPPCVEGKDAACTPPVVKPCVAGQDAECTPPVKPCLPGNVAGPQMPDCTPVAPVTPSTPTVTVAPPAAGVLSAELIRTPAGVAALAAVSPQALPTVAPAATPLALPFTGADLALLLPVALLALAFGIALIVAGRRQAARG